ncbi:MAG: radical SAM protein [Deltaproteobacteria bacterium]|nr:radical SAM protein [Deltaproteobacteria bacterium]
MRAGAAPAPGDGQGRSGSPYTPRLIFWEVTKGCNLRCAHCRAEPLAFRPPEDLSTAAALRLIEAIAARAKPVLVFSGGEPLYRRDLFELARHAGQQGLLPALATNGTLITAALAEQVVGAGFRRVSISLDGATAATHDAFRRMPGAFERAVRGLLCLKALGMSLQINTTLTRHNVRELPAILDLAEQLGADALHLFMLVPVGCGLTLDEGERLPAEAYEEILTWFYDQEQVRPLQLKATCAPHYFRIMRQRAAARGEPLPASYGRQLHMGAAHQSLHSMTKGCLAGTGICFISHRGEVFPCGYLPVSAGDAARQPFGEIWDHSPVFRALRDPGLLKGKCGRCEFKQICEGCRARAYAQTGDYLDEEPYCLYQPAVSLAAGQA